MTKAFQILAGILAILGTLLIHNYHLAGFIFYALAIMSYFASLITHRKEEQSKRTTENNRLLFEQDKQKLELFKEAKSAYKGHETVALQNTIRSFNISESEKHDLYHAVVLDGRGRSPKTNPFKK